MRHRTQNGSWNGTQNGRHAVGTHAVGTGERAHDARVTTEGGEEEVEYGASTCVSEGCPGLEG